MSASAKSRVLWLSHRGAKIGRPRILSPADVEALTVSSRFSGRDSDLEAFGHNPSDGSFGTIGLSAKHVNQMSEPAVPLVLKGLPLQRRVISRVKLTCLTTV